MRIDPNLQSKKDNYKLLIGTILPRPIAFVTSITKEGVVNAAPFSFFNIVGTEPPLIGFSCGRKKGGVMKDTARNILSEKEFVVHIVSHHMTEMVNDTAIDFPPDQSEAEAMGFKLLPSYQVKVPRVAEAKVQMECVLYQHMELGIDAEGNPSTDFIIGKIVQFHIADDIYEDGKIHLQKLNPVSRLAGNDYGTIGEIFSLVRPTYEDWKKRQK